MQEISHQFKVAANRNAMLIETQQYHMWNDIANQYKSESIKSTSMLDQNKNIGNDIKTKKLKKLTMQY